jgi:hypothetical protein
MKIYKSYRVMDISPDLTMRYAHIFDGLPPLYQTTCKIIAVATLTEFFRLSVSVLWAVLNDLIEQGVEEKEVDALLREMEEMYVTKRSIEKGSSTVTLLSPVRVWV